MFNITDKKTTNQWMKYIDKILDLGSVNGTSTNSQV